MKAVSEIEPFPCAVLEHHYPRVPNLGDVTKITEQQIKDLGQIDLIVFGSPCQNLSVAGNRKGLQGDQSSLFYAAMEIIKYAKRHCKTRFALWENVPGAFSSNKGADFTEVVKHMMYFGGACFKYLYRCGNKWDDIEDLKKAVRCAELADGDRFITDESWLRAMYQVASHRDGNIQQAMFSIRCQQWGDVIEDIKAEIARLESEAVDD